MNYRHKDGRERTIILSPRYIKGVLHNLKVLVDYYGVEFPTVKTAIDLVRRWENEGKSGNTIHNYLYALRFWAYSMGMDFDFKIPGSRRTVKVVEPLTLGEIRRLVDYGNSREAVITVLGSICGLRPVEQENVKIDDLQFDSRIIVLPRTKGGRPETAFLTQQSIEVIKNYLPFREELLNSLGKSSDYLLIKEDGGQLSGDRLNKIMSQHSRRTLGRTVGPRLLRTSCATNLAMSCDNTSIAAAALHHSDTKTTERYYIQPRQKVIQDVIERYSRF
jgi:integrase